LLNLLVVWQHILGVVGNHHWVVNKTLGPLCVTCYTSVNATVADSVRCCMIYGTVPSPRLNASSDGSDVIAGGSVPVP